MSADITFTDPRGNKWIFEGTWNFEMIGADYEGEVLMGRLRPAEDGCLERGPEEQAAIKERLRKTLAAGSPKQLPAGD